MLDEIAQSISNVFAAIQLFPGVLEPAMEPMPCATTHVGVTVQKQEETAGGSVLPGERHSLSAPLRLLLPDPDTASGAGESGTRLRTRITTERTPGNPGRKVKISSSHPPILICATSRRAGSIHKPFVNPLPQNSRSLLFALHDSTKCGGPRISALDKDSHNLVEGAE